MDKKVCTESVCFDGWHYTSCSKPVVVERDGLPYCTIHDPEYIKAKRSKRDAVRKTKACPKCGSSPHYSFYAFCPLCGTKYPNSK